MLDILGDLGKSIMKHFLLSLDHLAKLSILSKRSPRALATIRALARVPRPTRALDSFQAYWQEYRELLLDLALSASDLHYYLRTPGENSEAIKRSPLPKNFRRE